jgi:type I restriction enzyme S subunit
MIGTGPSVVHLARFTNGYPFKPEDLGADGAPVVRIRQLVDPSADLDRAMPPDRAVWIGDGDLVFSWSATLAVRLWSRGPALLNQHLFRVDTSPSVDRRWFRYVLEAGIERLRPLMHGSAMTHITGEMLRLLRVSLPPLAEQRWIAGYLDAEIARMDALILTRQRQVELLSERPWVEFTDSVRALVAPKVPLRRALIAITDGPFGSAFTADDYSDEGAFVVRLGNIGFGQFLAEPAARIPEELYRTFGRHHVRPGDLLIAGLGDDNRHAGRAALAPDLGPMMVKGKCYCAQVDPRRAVPQYLALYLSSVLGADQVALESHGSGRAMINLDIAKSLIIALPPITEQADVVRRFEKSVRDATQLADSLNRSIDLLLERREALITAAVSGQLEIPGAAA